MLGVTNSVSCYIVPHQSMSLTADISAAPALTDQALANCLEAKDRRHIAWMPVLQNHHGSLDLVNSAVVTGPYLLTLWGV